MGVGVANVAGGSEPGWVKAPWDSYVGARSATGEVPSDPGATTIAAWDTNLRCNSVQQAWTSAVGANERRPMNCLSWYDLYAFCIWDRGFLPTEAEWEYASSGGAEQRVYPWGSATPTTSLAVYSTTVSADVGALAAGNGRWGHSDLAGNIHERNLDRYQSYPAACTDCASLSESGQRVIRGGAFNSGASSLLAGLRNSTVSASRAGSIGGRCARTP